MSKRSELDLDGALAALARETHRAAPLPDYVLTAGVLADAALTVLAREAADASPRPSAELLGRVLADAAEVAAGRGTRPAAAPARSRAGAAPAGLRLVEWLFGWQAGAVAAMALALAIGLGIGLEMEPGAVPILDRGDQSQPISLASLDPDVFEVSGL